MEAAKGSRAALVPSTSPPTNATLNVPGPPNGFRVRVLYIFARKGRLAKALPSLLLLFLLCALALFVWCAYFTSGVWGHRSGYKPPTDEETPRGLIAYGGGDRQERALRELQSESRDRRIRAEVGEVASSLPRPLRDRPQFGPLTPDYTEFGALVVPPL